MSAADLSHVERDADSPVDAVTEIRQCLPGTAEAIAARVNQPTAYILETLDAMRRAGIIVASNDHPPVWSSPHRLRAHCASSGQA